MRAVFALDTVLSSQWGLQTQWEAHDVTEDATRPTLQLANWPKVRCTVPPWGCGQMPEETQGFTGK